MKLEIGNFIIEEDKYGFILEEYGDKKNPKDGTISYGLKDQLFPATLERSFNIILHRMKGNKQKTLELEEYIKEIKKINDKFIKDLKELLK